MHCRSRTGGGVGSWKAKRFACADDAPPPFRDFTRSFCYRAERTDETGETKTFLRIRKLHCSHLQIAFLGIKVHKKKKCMREHTYTSSAHAHHQTPLFTSVAGQKWIS